MEGEKTINIHSFYDLIIVGAGPAGITAALYAQKLGMNYLLIEKNRFPKDKICGDAIAPVVYNLLHDLDIDLNLCPGIFKPSSFRFIFSSKETEINHVSHMSDRDKMVNIRRSDFDSFLFKQIKDSSRVCFAKVVSFSKEKKTVEIDVDGTLKQIEFNKLMLATGSGKNFIPTEKQDETVMLASRYYIKTSDEQKVNIIEFYEEILPGYFWAFPLGKGVWNTGLLLQHKDQFHQLYHLFEERLKKHFNDYEILSKDKFPLRISPFISDFQDDNIALVGDSHHQIDALLGHGIDAAILEAREQIYSLYASNKFAGQTKILNLIHDKNIMSHHYKNKIQTEDTPEKQLVYFGEFITHLSEYYAGVISEISNHSDKNTTGNHASPIRENKLQIWNWLKNRLKIS